MVEDPKAESSQTEVSDPVELEAHVGDSSAENDVESSDPVVGSDAVAASPDLLKSGMKWYVVNTYSGSEETAKIALLEKVSRAGLQDQFGEIIVPKIVVERVLKSGKKKMVDKTSFPGYIMVQMKMTDSSMNCVSSTPKISGFIGNRHNPRPMPDQEVLRLLNPEVAQEVEAEQVSTISFEKGESVKVTDGPFTNFDGVIEEVKPDKMKIRVLVSIFGRETPVELGYNQVQKLD